MAMPATPRQQAQWQQRLLALGQTVRDAVAAGRHEEALQAARQALQLAPGHPVVLGDLALCCMRLGRLQEALDAYRQAARAAPQDENIADGLAECLGRLGQADQLAREGRRALALKAAQVAATTGWPLPPGDPPRFDASRPARNVVSYSLFGDNPRYCETAVLNVAEARRWLPGWTCRFHVDASVPVAVLQRLRAAGAELVDMQAHPARDVKPLMWRFLVLDDPGVDRYLLRDADALVSTREAAAVQAWLDSGRWFHLMRDAHTHTELLLAGLWGGCGGVFRDVAAQLLAYSRQPPRLSARVIDQQWLREHAWPTVRASVLAHDSCFGFEGGLPFPAHEPVQLGSGFHVGGDICPGAIGGTAALADGERVNWRLLDEHGTEVCRYATPVSGGAWRAALPLPYTTRLQAGQWRLQVAR